MSIERTHPQNQFLPFQPLHKTSTKPGGRLQEMSYSGATRIPPPSTVSNFYVMWGLFYGFLVHKLSLSS